MSSHKEFLEEKEKIDKLVENGFRIAKVEENLSGAFVDFEKPNEKKQVEKKQLHILNADARIYFSNLLIKQQKQQ
nr:hypothetical protein [Bacillus piscicola]